MTTRSSEAPAREQLSAWHRWELGSLAPDPRTAATGADAIAAERARVTGEAQAAGYAAGLAAAAAERAQLARLLDKLAACAADHEQRLCDEVLDLALVFARQMVGEALSVRREFVLPVVTAALKQLPQSTQRVELFLSAGDVELVRAHIASADLGTRCRLSVDPTIAPGGCRVETEQLELDMTTPLRWRRLLALLGRSDDWLEPV